MMVTVIIGLPNESNYQGVNAYSLFNPPSAAGPPGGLRGPQRASESIFRWGPPTFGGFIILKM